SVCGGVNHGTLFFPETSTPNFASYQFWSVVGVFCKGGVSIVQQGSINPMDTIHFGTGVVWSGVFNSSVNGGQFAWSRHPTTRSSTAYPLIYQDDPNGVFELRDLTIVHDATNAGQVIVKDTGGIPAGIIRDCILGTAMGGSDYTSTLFVWRNNISGGGNFVFEKNSMTVGAGPGVPLVLITGGGSPFMFRDIMLSKRGMFIGNNGATGVNVYEQGAFMPKLTVFGFGGFHQPVGINWTDSIEDTTSSPAIAYSNANGTTLTGNIVYGGNSVWGAVQGNGLVSVTNYGNAPLQNSLLTQPSRDDTVEDGINSIGNQPVFGIYQDRHGSITQRVGPKAQFFVGASPPPNPTFTPVAG